MKEIVVGYLLLGAAFAPLKYSRSHLFLTFTSRKAVSSQVLDLCSLSGGAASGEVENRPQSASQVLDFVCGEVQASSEGVNRLT